MVSTDTFVDRWKPPNKAIRRVHRQAIRFECIVTWKRAIVRPRCKYFPVVSVTTVHANEIKLHARRDRPGHFASPRFASRCVASRRARRLINYRSEDAHLCPIKETFAILA